MKIFKFAVITLAATGTIFAGTQAYLFAADAAGTSQYASRTPIEATRPVAVELFTSQGCSSCPPADMIAGKFARDKDIVMITRPVTYWNRLGWTDTLARESNDRLQRSYARTDMAGKGVYTPQMVINGRVGLIGSSELSGRSLIKRAAQSDMAASIRILPVKSECGQRAIMVAGPSKGDATVTLVALKSLSKVAIGRGENGGRMLGYHNVLVGETDLGKWMGGSQVVKFDAAKTASNTADRYAVIVRGNVTGHILGASYI